MMKAQWVLGWGAVGLVLAESPSLSFPLSPPCPQQALFSGLLGDNLIAPRLLSST